MKYCSAIQTRIPRKSALCIYITEYLQYTGEGKKLNMTVIRP